MNLEPVEVVVDGLEWDDDNIDHIASHGVEVEDVVAVLNGKPQFCLNRPDRTATHVMVGHDLKGRALFIALLEVREGVWRTITAYESREVRKALEAMGHG